MHNYSIQVNKKGQVLGLVRGFIMPVNYITNRLTFVFLQVS